jgi:hypothetical protein
VDRVVAVVEKEITQVVVVAVEEKTSTKWPRNVVDAEKLVTGPNPA